MGECSGMMAYMSWSPYMMEWVSLMWMNDMRKVIEGKEGGEVIMGGAWSFGAVGLWVDTFYPCVSERGHDAV